VNTEAKPGPRSGVAGGHRPAVVLVTWVGEATGSKAATAALACAGSDLDRPGLLVDLGGRPPRPTVVASSAARTLEERLSAHLPEARMASRGQTCHLVLPGEVSGIEAVPAALALVRESVGVVHVPPQLLQPVLAESRVRATGVLLRADLDSDRALTALAVRDLLRRRLSVAVLKQPLAWIPARRALFGVLASGASGALPDRLVKRLLAPVEHRCYGGRDDPKTDPARASQPER
jgi:hypothetical protein